MSGNGKNRGRDEAAVSRQRMAEMGEGDGLPGDSASCQEMAKIEGEMRLPLAAREWQKWKKVRGSREIA